VKITVNRMDIMKHAYGYHSKDPGFRTHYQTNIDNPEMIYLVEHGYFQGPTGIGHFGENGGMFHLTDKAIGLLTRVRRQENELDPRLE